RIDREMRVVGLAFESNIEGLPNELLVRPDSGGRTASVAAAGILEEVRSVYQATARLDAVLPIQACRWQSRERTEHRHRNGSARSCSSSCASRAALRAGSTRLTRAARPSG